jgi:hypothetical protein
MENKGIFNTFRFQLGLVPSISKRVKCVFISIKIRHFFLFFFTVYVITQINVVKGEVAAFCNSTRNVKRHVETF